MEAQSTVQIPRVVIRFCTQCKWNLRAAYYAQELLQTFSTSLGEISLVPCTGGIFSVTLYHAGAAAPAAPNKAEAPGQSPEHTPSLDANPTTRILETLIWDRKRDGGFPETKELKNRVRNVVDPARDMGHIDRVLKRDRQAQVSSGEEKKEEEEEEKEEQPEVVGEESKVEAGEERGAATGGGTLDFGKNVQGVEGLVIDPETGKPDEKGRERCEDCK